MPDAGLALAISTIAHAGALVVLGLVGAVEREKPVVSDDVPGVAIEIPVEVEVHPPIDVALAPAGTSTRDDAIAIPAHRTAGSRLATARATATDRTGETTSDTHTTGTDAGRGLLKMRGADLTLSGEVAARIAEAGEPPPVVVPSGKLKPGPGGTARIRDAVANVDVHRDGTVTMHHAPDFEIHLKLPVLSLSKIRAQIGESIDDWYKDAYAEARRVGRATDLPRHEQAIPGGCDHYGDPCGISSTPSSGPSDDDSGGGLMFIEGKADIVSWLAKKTGVGDLYASRKRKLLDDTRDERIGRGGAYRAEQLDRSAELIRQNLERLWASTRDPAARRRALFELWDECGEGSGPLGEAGDRARGQVIGWIAVHLPAGSADAFTDGEIASLDARRSSKQHFAPY